jgi:recombination associated protein RdgC
MPALSGSLTYARLFVEGTLPDDFRERFGAAIQLRAMRPLEADDEALERSGWCAIGDPFELDLGYERVFYNDYVNLGLRTDRWSIPAALVRTHLKEAEAAYLEKKKRQRLSKHERAELKELVLRQLRKQSVPSVRAVDFSWSLGEGIVRFFSHAQRPTATLVDLFGKTFSGLKLVPEAPYTLASRLGLSTEEEAAWDRLEPTDFITQPAMGEA